MPYCREWRAVRHVTVGWLAYSWSQATFAGNVALALGVLLEERSVEAFAEICETFDGFVGEHQTEISIA